MNLKRDLRKKIIIKRNELDRAQIKEKSQVIAQKILESEFYSKADCILFYAPFNNEVETDNVIKSALQDEKTVCLPVAVKEERKLLIKKITSLDDLEIGSYGIREPKTTLQEVSPQQLDLVIVPGCCFDRKGYRLGYGGGYYDRFLRNLYQTKKIALAFEFQVIDELPCEEHDEKVDAIITEEKIYSFSNS